MMNVIKSENANVNKSFVCNNLPLILPSLPRDSGSECAIQGEICRRIPVSESGGVEAVEVICLSWQISSDRKTRNMKINKL